MTNSIENYKTGFLFRRKSKAEREVPINLEQILFSAAEDEHFCKAFLSKREQALNERGFRLVPSERDVLLSIPQHLLEYLISQLRPQKNSKVELRNTYQQTLAVI